MSNKPDWGKLLELRRIPPGFRLKRREILAGGAPGRIRRIHCGRWLGIDHDTGEDAHCGTVLAEEAGPIGGTAIEWRFINKDGHWVNGKWWGNPYICPGCGIVGTLPIDKPLIEESPTKITEV